MTIESTPAAPRATDSPPMVQRRQIPTEQSRLLELRSAKANYQTLIARKNRQGLTAAEQSALTDIKAHINALEAERPRPDDWDKSRAEVRRELAGIRAEAVQLADVVQPEDSEADGPASLASGMWTSKPTEEDSN